MGDPFNDLYDQISERKHKPSDYEAYAGGNGRIDRAVDLILNEDFPRSGCLLDVGGATGNLGYALKEQFERRITVDIAEVCRGPAQWKGNAFLKANVDLHGFSDETGEWRVEDGTVDLIVALDFIEHILDPQKFASECQRVLKPGGKVLINTPNIQFWKHLYSLVVDGRFPHTSGDREVYHGGHVAFYNFQDMVQIFSFVSGFIDPRMHTRGLTPEAPPPIWMTLARDFPFPGIQLSYPDLVFSCRKP